MAKYGKKDLWNPFESRAFRFKKVAFEFFCPLCRTKRAISTGHRLSWLNYGQITLLTGLTTFFLWPWANVRGFLSFFLYFVAFEGMRRVIFSREVPCPHCGFDASWYKRDVTVAKQIVEDFWQENSAGQDSVSFDEDDDAAFIAAQNKQAMETDQVQLN